MDDLSHYEDPDTELREMLERLRQAHQDLDEAVRALETLPGRNQLHIARLKKRKLVLRDQIATIDNRLTPDIIA